jgi:hypothetical protein
MADQAGTPRLVPPTTNQPALPCTGVLRYTGTRVGIEEYIRDAVTGGCNSICYLIIWFSLVWTDAAA